MSDTQRTTAALQALLADNVTGAITPQQLRDMLVSCFGGYGWMYVENGAVAQTVNIAPSQLTAFAANGISNGPTPDQANDQIAIAVAGDYWASGEFALSGAAGRTIQFQLRKNGIAVAGSRSRAKFDSAGDLFEVSFSGLVTCASGDLLSVWVAADVDGTSITVVDATLSVRRLG